MRDLGHEETEEVLKKIEKRISAEYRQAEREIAAKLDDYMKRFVEKDKLKLLGVANGQITEEEYKQWRLGQVMIGKRWSEMRDSLAKDFANTSQIARSIAFDHIPEVYAINHDYGTFQVEKGSLTDTSYTLYDRQSIEQLYKNEDTFIPAPGRKVKRAINEGKQIAWDKKQVQSAMMQGLLQGESIPNIATRLAKSVGEGDRKAAIRNARTLTTGIENAGRVASYDRANAMGIKTKKQWLAALDMRTRHWHASLDGVSVENDKPFTNDYGKIMYPGDPEADPANIYNCRCTLIADIEGFENDLSDMSLRHNEKLGDMSYDEWKKGHYDMESDRITKQDEIAETMRYAYGAEYRKYKKYEVNASEAIPKNKDGKEIEFDWKGKNDKFANQEELIKALSNEYNTRVQTVTIGAHQAAGDVDISGAMLRVNTTKPSAAIHEFAHTLANSQAEKYGLTNDEEFWKEIKKIRKEYHNDVDTSQDTSRWISSYEHSSKSIDEFFAEAFCQAKMNQMGLSLPEKYGKDLTYSNKVLNVVDRKFKKNRNSY